VPFELGVVWSGGAPLPHLLSSGQRAFVAFYLDIPDPNWDGTYTRIVDLTADTAESLALAELSAHAHASAARGVDRQALSRIAP
jgi:hypothetical protein